MSCKPAQKIFLIGFPVRCSRQDLLSYFSSLFPKTQFQIELNFKNNGENLGWAILGLNSLKVKKKILQRQKFVLLGKSFYAKKYLKGRQREKFKQNLWQRKLFVRGLPRSAKNKDLFNFFQKFGKLEDAYIIEKKPEKGRGGQYPKTGFLIFKEKERAEQLLSIGEVQFRDRLVSVERIKKSKNQNLSKPKKSPGIEPGEMRYSSRNTLGNLGYYQDNKNNFFKEQARNEYQSYQSVQMLEHGGRNINQPNTSLLSLKTRKDKRTRIPFSNDQSNSLEQEYQNSLKEEQQLYQSGYEVLTQRRRQEQYQKYEKNIEQRGQKNYQRPEFEHNLSQIGPYFINGQPVYPDTNIQLAIEGQIGYQDNHVEGRQRIPSFSFTTFDNDFSENICKISVGGFLNHESYNLRINFKSKNDKDSERINRRGVTDSFKNRNEGENYCIFPKKKSSSYRNFGGFC